jgi:hypothetical protein
MKLHSSAEKLRYSARTLSISSIRDFDFDAKNSAYFTKGYPLKEGHSVK